MDERRLLAADERPCTVAYLDVERETRTHDVVAQQAVLPRLCDGHFEPVDSQRILRADVYHAFRGSRAVAVDGHGFDDGVGVAFEYRAVHESPRVAFVGIADDVFLVGLHLAGDFPFESRRETAAAAAAQSGVHNLADDLLRSHLKYLAQGGVTVAGDVFVDVLRVDEAAVAQGDADLGFIELHVLGVGDVSARVGGDIEQALHLASLDDVFADDGLGVFRFDRYVEGIVGHRLDDGALFAEAEAAGAYHLHLV